MSLDLLAAPAVLRAAGLTVNITRSWLARPLGSLVTLRPSFMWHHDASPAGPSPGALEWLISQYLRGWPSAQLWVDTRGIWWAIGSGRAAHAGAVAPGHPGNPDSVGIETDHTVGEPWPALQLQSLRLGTAALLNASGRPAETGLWFHKDSAVPPGRKPDPDGLTLADERKALSTLQSRLREPVSKPSAPPPAGSAGQLKEIPDMIVVRTTTTAGDARFGTLNADGKITAVWDPVTLAGLSGRLGAAVTVALSDWNHRADLKLT